MAWTEKDWQRLGDRMRSSRLRLSKTDPDCKTKESFAVSIGINPKTYGDIEAGRLGKRKSFSWETIALIEEKLDWAPGVSRAVLDDDGFVDVESGIRIKDAAHETALDIDDLLDMPDDGRAIAEFMRQRDFRKGKRDVGGDT